MLLLFDIDGTLLLKASREHALALYAGMASAHGREIARAQVPAAGRTDPAIARSILEAAGVPAAAIEERAALVAAATAAEYAERCPADLTGLVNPSMPGVLAGLREAGHRLSLVTGNYEAVARLKLARAGLDGYFPAGQGAFGSDAEDRAALPGLARARAGVVGGTGGAAGGGAGSATGAGEGGSGAPWPRADTVVVGDTPLDIACARADGVRCVAIATGPHRVDELADADAVITHAIELPAALAAL